MKYLSRKEAGAEGEQIALDHLTRRGLRLIVRNHHCRGGELDLAMLDGSTLALIEVRRRADDRYGGAAASVTPAKQRRIIIAAKHLLLTRKDLARRRVRFDVVALETNERNEVEIEWIKDAFRT